MSYILEALKKSEQTRGHGTAPGIQTIHSSSLSYRPATRNIWPWVLIAAVLLNLAVLLYFVFHKNTSVAVSTQTPGPAPAVKKDSTVSSNITRPAQHEPSTLPQPVQQPVSTNTSQPQVVHKPEIDTTSTTQTPAYTANEDDTFDAVDISQLPQNIQNQIPAMKFTAHVYSSDPKQRSVVINGHYVEEGANLGDGLILKKITPNGVIMDFRGHLFRTNVISGW